MPKQTKPISLPAFKGINNIDSPETMGSRFLQGAVNIDLDDAGKVSKRTGTRLIKSGKTHSLYSDSDNLLFVIDDILYKNNIAIATDIKSKLHYITLQGKIYFTSRTRTGIIDGNTVTNWSPKENTNFLKIDSWEDQFGHVYDVVNHEPIFYQNGPQGQDIAVLGGRIYIASGSSLLFTEALSPLWFMGASIEFNHRIKALMPVESGMWVAADALYFLSGLDPSEFKVNKLEDCTTVEGTHVKVPGDRVPILKSPSGDTWLVTTSNGIIALKDNGFIANMSETNYELPYAEYGAAGFLETGGINRYVTNMQQTNTNRAAIADSMTVRIIRNT